MKISQPSGSVFLRLVGIVLINALILQGLLTLQSTRTSLSFRESVTIVIIIALLTTQLQPLLLRPAVFLPPWAFVVVSFLINAILTISATVSIRSQWFATLGDTLLFAALFGGATTIVNQVMAVGDDGDWHLFALQPIRQRYRGKEPRDENAAPGFAFLEIDGLSCDTLNYGRENGYTPILDAWLREGTHRLVQWECDLSSQTGASQAGILEGSNWNVPAYRWYDRATRRIIVSTTDARFVQASIRGDTGLLAHDGASRGNMFSGDAADSLFTFSTLRDRSSSKHAEYYAWFWNFHNIVRVLTLFVLDIVKELVAATWQRWTNERPRIARNAKYAIVRSATTSLLRELSTFTVAADMLRGVSSMYTTFIAYDEVAHHSGIRRGDTMRVLRQVDRDIGRLRDVERLARRPYHLIVLSDHGQSQGQTFRQLHGWTHADLVHRLMSGDARDEVAASVRSHLTTDEGAHLLSALVQDSAGTHESARDRVLASLESEHHLEQDRRAVTEDAVVLASGNLGLVYFADTDQRLTLEEINDRYPQLMPGLVVTPGIGWVAVESAHSGPLVIGPAGVIALRTGEVSGINPLESFGERAPRHILRHSEFDNAPDILMGSSWDPETDEIHAFEELVGSHGGIGGAQAFPFILAPVTLPLPDEDIVGAEQVNRLLRGWIAASQGGASP